MANTLCVTLFTSLVFVFCYREVSSVWDRKSPMGGGWADLPVDSEKIKNLSDFVVDMYNKRSNAINYKQLLNITESRRQVVAGFKYFISIVIGENNCKKNQQQNNLKGCQLTNTNTIETCNATIWERGWLNSTQLLTLECK